LTFETRVDLLRHGETVGGSRLRGGRCDDALSQRGIEQLEAAVDAGSGWQVVVTSPLARCRSFAESLVGRSNCELRVDERFREYDFGDWDGRGFDELWREHGDELAAFFGDPDSVTPPGGETAEAFRSRVRAAWQDLLSAHAGRHLLLIGHGGVLRQIVADVLGVPGPVHAALEWPNAAMSRVRVFDDPPNPRSQSLVWHGRVFY
jgi:broad specificity phosphatase PhoE